MIEQRLRDLEDHISKDLALQKKYEEKLRLTDDPRTEARCLAEIQRQKKVIAEYQQEYKELTNTIKKQSKYFSPEQQQQLSKQLKRITIKLDDFSNKIQPIELQPISYSNFNNIVNQETKTNNNLTKIKNKVIKQKLKGNYSQLHEFLKRQQWREADQETIKMILEINNKTVEERLIKEEIENFPCKDLNVINNLWLKYSQQQFGFTVQQKIWQEVGGELGIFNGTIFYHFSDRVGWRRNEQWLLNYNDLNFTSDCPPGHFPTLRVGNNKQDELPDIEDNFRYFLSRIQSCLSNQITIKN